MLIYGFAFFILFLTRTVVVAVRPYTVLAAAKQNKIHHKGDLKLWHVEMLTKEKL